MKLRIETASRSLQALGWTALAAFVPLVVVLMSGGGTAKAQSSAFDHEGFAREVLESHIRPGFEKLGEAVGSLSESINSACDSRDPSHLEAVREVYREAVLAWSRVEHLNFGPAREDNRFSRIVFWPDRQNIGRRQVSRLLKKRDPKALSLDTLRQKSVAVQGLTALEILFFGKRADAVLQDNEDGAYRCGYAKTVAENVVGTVSEISEGWADTSEFVGIWLKTGKDNPLYKSERGPTAEMLKSLRFGINNVREVKLLSPLGKKRDKTKEGFLKATKPSFARSGLSVSVMIANLEGVRSLFNDGGFAAQIEPNEPESVELINAELDVAVEVARDVEEHGAKAFVDPAHAEALEEMRFPLRVIQISAPEVLAAATGMVLGFTDDDGD